jgi:uncharacterized membrane protein
LTNFLTKNLKERPWTASSIWLSLSLIIWFLGVGGRDLYALPSLVGFILLFIEVLKKQSLSLSFSFIFKPSFIILNYIIVSIVVLLTTILSLYSFRWNIWDVGSYSSAIFNLSKGLNFNSYLQLPASSDHFTPSLAIFVPLYWLYPSVHWLTVAKALSYLSVPAVVYWWLKDKTDKKNCLALSSVFGIWLLLLYKPAVNSRLFEFSPSSIALPFIILAFAMMEKRRWLFFAMSMIFLLGLKEHMGIVLIGFGLFKIFQRDYITGALLSGLGFLISYTMIFQVMPYFRDYQTFINTQIDPFHNIQGKLIYLFKLNWPLVFLPLIFWRYGIIAAPAIGVNLISGRESMFSSSFHYDDISSILLLIASVMVVIEKRDSFLHWLKFSWSKYALLFLIFGVMLLLPTSPIRKLKDAIPQKIHWELLQEVKAIDIERPAASLAVQSTIGPHFHRTAISMMTQSGEKCVPPKVNGLPVDIILLSPDVGHHMINYFVKCIESLEANSLYNRTKSFQHLFVYELSVN